MHTGCKRLFSARGLLSGFMLLALAGSVQAAGPDKVATLERSLWPETISDTPAFDRASQAEILTFARLLEQTDLSSEQAIRDFTGLSRVNHPRVARWQQITRQRLLANYRAACGNCELSTDWNGLTEAAFAAALVDKSYRPWQRASEQFHRRYLYEQVRLAALFPRISSEIDTFREPVAAAAPVEITGFELPDRQFLLSYDDGPSAQRTGPLVDELQQAGISAYFFVLGEKLSQNPPPPGRYRGQCLASHGYRHVSHQKMRDWATSLTDTRKAIRAYQGSTAATPVAFRPPYGQRHQGLVDDLAKRGESVVLWNIDSQDWNRRLSADQVQDRVQTLMLLWRRGIILYHDIHAKAQHNLPGLIRFQQQAGLEWRACSAPL